MAQEDSSSAVQQITSSENDDNEDPVERMLKKTGCLEKHYSVQECIFEKKDWRQCQKEVADFRLCMEKHNTQKSVVTS